MFMRLLSRSRCLAILSPCLSARAARLFWSLGQPPRGSVLYSGFKRCFIPGFEERGARIGLTTDTGLLEEC